MAASADTLSHADHLQQQLRQSYDQRASQRSKRTVPNFGPALASMRTSFSQLSTNDDQKGQRRQHSTTAPPPGLGAREGSVESANSKSARSLSGSNDSNQEYKPSLPPLQIPYSKRRANKSDKGAQAEAGASDEDDSYFGDILDKYCHSDDDPTSPSTASPTSPFSTAQSWVDFKSAQPPTPPVTSSRHLQNQNQAIVPPRRVTPLRTSLSAVPSAGSSVESSPMLAASARFNAYLQSSSNRSSQDSFSLNGLAAVPSTRQSSPSPSPTMRAYAKRPVPVPASVSSSVTASPRASVVSIATSQGLRDSKLEPPPKDSSRQLLRAQQQSNSSSQQPQQLNTFPSVVEETMKRNRTASVSSFASSTGSINPYAENATRDRSNSTHSQLSYMAGKPRDRYSAQQQQQQKQHDLYYQGHNGSTSPISRSQGNEEQQYYQQWQQQPQQQHDQQQSATESPYHQMQRSSRHSSPALTPSEMLSRRFEDRSRVLGHGVIPTASKHTGTSGMKSALVKTPMARTRTKEIHGSRKVIFGDIITIVTVERAETPPPLTPADKKKKKKKTKKGSSKAGPHPDPEYDSDYYNAPYTPEPAEVVVTQAPWIGNPNYDEEKANSKFYDDDYEYEGDGYDNETPQDIRLGPDDDDEDDEDEDDEDEDEDDDSSIAGGGSSPKKKGGIFKFKRAVNRLLRN
ncbi:hypothetical protein EDD21DRAFT_373105 [Dissophora ornata]|nr:hypothetical protein EDD21DRAFT_373105 [Dissophora ornata]